MANLGGESIDETLVLEILLLSMPPLKAPQFFIGLESLKDVWVNKLGLSKKILVTNQVKQRKIPGHCGCNGGPEHHRLHGIPQKSRKNDGVVGSIFLDFWFQRCFMV